MLKELLHEIMAREALAKLAVDFGSLEQHPGLVYQGPGDFVLSHGVFFHKATCPPGERAPARMCFGIAINHAAWKGEKYFEGFAWAPGTNQLMHHAWTVRPEEPDVALDRTWPIPGILYVGVEFSVERADDATWNGDAAVLIDEARGYQLYRQPWEGEPPDLVWPPSERLEILRSRDTRRAVAFLAANGR